MRRRFWVGASLVGLVALLAGSAPALAANVYVSSFASGAVSQYAVAADGSLVALSPATVASGTGSQGITLSPDRGSVYVANNSANTVAQFSVGSDGTLSAKSPATIAVTRPVGVAVSPDGKSVYVTSQTSGVIAQFDVAADGTLSPKSPATVAAPVNEGDIVVNAASTRAYVGNTGSGGTGTVSQFAIAADGTLSSLTPATVASGGNQSTGLGLSPDGTHLYVANRGANSVSWMQIAADGALSLQGTIAAGAQPNDVTVSPDGRSAYAANQNASANTISQYTIAADGSLSNKIPSTLSSPSTPKAVAFSTDGTNAYVPHQNSADVGLFSVGADGTLTAKSPPTVPAAAGAFALVYSEGPPVTAIAPVATTGGASAITDTGATVSGAVDANGTATYYTFEYGPSTSFGSISTVSSAGNGSEDTPQSADLAGLTPNTRYYYRLVASSSAGDSIGAVRTFKTTGGTAAAPAVITQPVSAITTTSAVLHGQVNPSGSQTAFTFEYGTSTAFGAITTVVALDDADVPEPVTAALSGLAPDTTYYYRVVAANATGTTNGATLRFSTGPGGLPAVTTGTAGAITDSAATLAGTVDAHGSQTAFAFEYGTTTSFGSLSAIDNAGDSNGVQQIALPVTGLSPGTTYLYRLVATNANGTSFGDVHSLTTTGSSAPRSGPADFTIDAFGESPANPDGLCTVRTVGQIACWGDGFGARFGTGESSTAATSMIAGAVGVTDAVQFAGGQYNGCALRATGQVMCWGPNLVGQLGNGSNIGSYAPGAVIGISDATQIAVAPYHVCALRAGGTVSCWGENFFGQLGDGTRGAPNGVGSSVPVTVTGLTDAVQISVGRSASCAVRATGAVVCWGAAYGNGPYEEIFPLPTQIAGITDALQVTSSDGDTCALRSNGHVACWGYTNTPGAAGQVRVATDVPDIADATQIAAGSGSVACALLGNGRMTCWDLHTQGAHPSEVAGITDAVQIAVGVTYSCAIRRKGSVVCTGTNFQYLNSPTPVTIPGVTDAGKPPSA